MIKIQNLVKSAVAAAVLGAASQAMASTIVLNPTGLPANGYLSAGSYTGSFDGSSALPSQFNIDTLSFTFNFKDDNNDQFSSALVSSGDTTVITTAKNGGVTTATATTTTTKYYTSTGEKETVALSFGNLVFNGSTLAGTATPLQDQNTPGTPVTSGTTYVKTTGGTTVICTPDQIAHDSSCKQANYVTVTNTVVKTTQTDYTGTITLQGDLLASLFQNKMLNFGLDVTGDLNLTNAALNVGFTEVLPPAGDVPEPGSLALCGIALVGLAGARRKLRG